MSNAPAPQELFKESDVPEELDAEILKMSNDEILQRIRLLENDVKVPFSPLVSRLTSLSLLFSYSYSDLLYTMRSMTDSALYSLATLDRS